MRRLTHHILSPPSRFARLMLAEKRLSCDLATPDEQTVHLPVFTDLDDTRTQGLWAIVDHLEGTYPEHPLLPEDAQARGESLRFLDWAMGPLHDSVIRRIVYEKASPRFTGASIQRAPDMVVIRAGREALKPALETIGMAGETHGYLATRECTLGDLGVAANLSALDYFGEVPWAEYPAAGEWYIRVKSRPAFRTLLADRVPGQPPVAHYGGSTADIGARAAILARAKVEGFDAARIARADAATGAGTHLAAFLAEGRHGSMDWMARNAEARAAPRALWPQARSVVMLAANYAPGIDPREQLTQKSAGAISVYAQGDDYHDVLKSKLKRLAAFVHTTFDADVKVFVDTAPVMEKPLAQQAGLGWQGKHTNLVSREFGSWLFLGSLFTTLELAPDTPEEDHCGQCRRCLDVCPTAAFTAPYRIDARRCISYLTIEHKGHIDREFRDSMGNRIYGCDDCLSVCPWNKFAQDAREALFHARDALKMPPLAMLARLDDAGFRALFRKSPIKRIGRDRFVRNVLIAIGNSQDSTLAAAAENLLGDPSPLVRAMAVWALSRLLERRKFGALAMIHAPQENDSSVLEEWNSAGIHVAPIRN